LTQCQRTLAAHQSVVMDGRDVGTVVLPDAQVKVFLTASLTERAKRRQQELANQGFTLPLEELEKALRDRDTRDTSRAVAPLKPAPDAHTIDTTGKSVEQVVQEILALVRQVQHE
ncbi:MAG: (d)CMP kinase, partial [Alicyclobacillus sp.]|nr:(d)CMP kinase [Alicyclobacillus sp.]